MKKQELKMSKDGWGLDEFDSYEGLWKSAGLEIVTSETLGSYQGDIVAILRDPDSGLYAYGHTGYGSCSGCDALQACSTIKDYEEIRDGLVDRLVWLPAAEMLYFLETHDWKGDYFSDSDSDFEKWLKASKHHLFTESRP